MRKTIRTKSQRRVLNVITLFVVVLILVITLSTDVVFSQHKSRTWRGLEGKALEYELASERNIGKDINKVIYTKRTAESPQKPRYIKSRLLSNGKGKSRYEFVKADDFQPIITTGMSAKLRFSTYGNYYVLTMSVKSKAGQTIPMRSTLYRYPNIKVWEKDFSRKLGLIVSDNGDAMVGITAGDTKGQFVFYNSKGDSINSAFVFSNPEYVPEKWTTGRYSEDGQYFVVVANNPGPLPDYPSSILLFSNTGELKWSFESPETGISGIVWPSADASYIISFHSNFTGKQRDRATYLHDREGNLIQRFEGLHTGYAVFSESQKYVILKESGQVNLIQCQTGEKVMRYNGAILDVDISEELGVVAILIGSVRGKTVNNPLAKFTNGKITVLNFNGVPAWEMNLPIIEEPQIGAKLSLSIDGKRIGIKLGSKYNEYELKE